MLGRKTNGMCVLVCVFVSTHSVEADHFLQALVELVQTALRGRKQEVKQTVKQAQNCCNQSHSTTM